MRNVGFIISTVSMLEMSHQIKEDTGHGIIGANNKLSCRSE